MACAFERRGCGADVNAVLIGDTKYDARGARRMETPMTACCGAMEPRPEMRAEGVERFVRTVEELQGLLITGQ